MMIRAKKELLLILQNSEDIRNDTGPAESLFINDNVSIPDIEGGEVLVKIKVRAFHGFPLLYKV